MSDRDVELGALSARPSESILSQEVVNTFDALPIHPPNRPQWHRYVHTYRDANLSATKSQEENGTRLGSAARLDDDEHVRLPRRKVEQLMGLWIDVLQESLQARKPLLDVEEESFDRHLNASVQDYHPARSTRYPPISYPPDAYPWATIEPMLDFELEAENEWRSSCAVMRKDWKDLLHLEDCWKHLWEPIEGLDKGLFQWEVKEDKRKMLQHNLIDALIANESVFNGESSLSHKDYRSISTYISLIGLRLNEQYPNYHGYPAMGPVKLIKILIECIWACTSFDPSNNITKGYREGPRLSNVLTACYRRRILRRPERDFDDHVTITLLKQHCQAVRRALYLVNLLHQHQISGYAQCENLDQARSLWSLPLPDVEATPTQLSHRSSTLRDGADTFLRIDDFNLRDLQTLGHLQIQWTSYWDEHLELQTSSTYNILKIYWFHPQLARYLVENHLCTQLSPKELSRREDELFRTWSLIFTSKAPKRQYLSRYKTLFAPRWLSLLGHTNLQTWTLLQATNDLPYSRPCLSRFLSPSSSLHSNLYTFEMAAHLSHEWSNDGKLPHDRISYSQFPVYGERLRELRIYMDSQQPTGLRALWKDRRNSNTYYTFWFVTIFGSLSVFLASAGLAVSIAQTWASFRQLDG